METTNSISATTIEPPERRHDLDALRAFAMLLGIILHASMSFIPGIGLVWGVEDSQAKPIYGVLLSLIHGWRMPLFFLISGYFTAMLWRKRGLKALLIHRFKRILLPLLLAMVTITPLMWAVSAYVRSQSVPQVARDAKLVPDSTTFEQLVSDVEKTKIDIFAAVATGDEIAIAEYIKQGGDVNVKNDQGSTPLHVACLFGRSGANDLLLRAGADLQERNEDGALPEDLLNLDWGTTAFIAQLVSLPVDRELVIQGRQRIANSIGEKTGRSLEVSESRRAVARDADGFVAMLIFLLFYFPVFHHLWFLWFLCWFVCGFAVIMKVTRMLGFPNLPRLLVISPIRYAWLIPLTVIPQYFMGGSGHAYGPDTSVGLLPLPAVLIYYAIFFGYGSTYFLANDQNVEVGCGYWWKLPIAILVIFPVGLSMQGVESTGNRIAFATMQVIYTWVMSFAMIGLFHQLCSKQRFWVRYLSDSSYWLYLTHLPLIILLQFVVRDWSSLAILKLTFICLVGTGLLLASYQLSVRNTWVGGLLNGRRYPVRQRIEDGNPLLDSRLESTSSV